MKPVNIETANARFAEVFAQHVQSLNLQVEDINREGAVLRMPYSDDLCRTGKVVRLGRSLIFGEVSVALESDPKLVCTATSTYAILR